MTLGYNTDDWVRSIKKIGPDRVSVEVEKPDGGIAFVEMSTKPIPATRNSPAGKGGVSYCEILKHDGKD